jgi:hypothetical protein
MPVTGRMAKTAYGFRNMIGLDEVLWEEKKQASLSDFN